MKKISLLLSFLFALTVFTSCDKDDDKNENGSGGINGGKGGSGKVVSSKETAAEIARELWYILNTIDSYTSTGTYSGDVLEPSLDEGPNASGSVTINGSKTSSVISYTTQTNTRFTLTFKNFTYNKYTFSGTIEYSQDYYNTSSYKRIRTAVGSNITISGNGVSDVVSIDLQRYHNSKTTKSSAFPLAGSIVSSNGKSYDCYDGYE
ncbi:MAG: hypothetical protein II129_03405 [Paludibacteraceae bacterium]|nr:hypothetical protein [Paludibacteraceae bacterium]